MSNAIFEPARSDINPGRAPSRNLSHLPHQKNHCTKHQSQTIPIHHALGTEISQRTRRNSRKNFLQLHAQRSPASVCHRQLPETLPRSEAATRTPLRFRSFESRSHASDESSEVLPVFSLNRPPLVSSGWQIISFIADILYRLIVIVAKLKYIRTKISIYDTLLIHDQVQMIAIGLTDWTQAFPQRAPIIQNVVYVVKVPTQIKVKPVKPLIF